MEPRVIRLTENLVLAIIIINDDCLNEFFLSIIIKSKMKKDTNDKMQKIISLAKRRGFIFPGSEIYGGLANSWDYGPLGVLLKNNIKNLWWKKFVQQRIDITGLDSAIMMNPETWVASGHLNNFTDPLVECKNCHERFRADIIDLTKPCEKCGTSNMFSDFKQFNLMFRTWMGPTQESGHAIYLRPETAQGIFVNFKNIVDSYGMKIPFGVAQIGKAFRNEITPGNYIFRTREFEQMEIEYFVHPNTWKEHFDTFLESMKEFVLEIGVDEKLLHYVEIPDNERAFYSKRTIDVQFDFPFGQKELFGLAYRTDYDLKQHQQYSGQKLTYRDPETGEEYIPHVIEPSLGVDRLVLAVLLSAYEEVDPRNGDEDSKHEKEVILRFNKNVTPIKIAVMPLSKKEQL